VASSALIAAAFWSRREVAECLLDRGANTEARETKGKTALIAAAEKGHRVVLECLLDVGADAEARDNNGKTAAEYTDANNMNGLRELVQSAPHSQRVQLRVLRNMLRQEEQEQERHRQSLISLATSSVVDAIYGEDERLKGSLPAAEAIFLSFSVEVDPIFVTDYLVALNSAEYLIECQRASEKLEKCMEKFRQSTSSVLVKSWVARRDLLRMKLVRSCQKVLKYAPEDMDACTRALSKARRLRDDLIRALSSAPEECTFSESAHAAKVGNVRALCKKALKQMSDWRSKHSREKPVLACKAAVRKWVSHLCT
jgi:hypothetical protein